MTFEKYITKGGKKYRLGYTTGTAAAGAAKAAALMLLNQEQVSQVVINTPYGLQVEMDVFDAEYNPERAQAAVVKDAGDDPDVTDGLKIYVLLERLNYDKDLGESIINIAAGEGVGIVTKKGLQLPVGSAAVNPTPRKMLKKAVREVFPQKNKFKLTISVPGGKEVAEKTFNPRLGIKGGISILGSSGIVEPMSESAYKESLAVELKQSAALGEKKLYFVFGNNGRDRLLELGKREEQIIRMSNFVGFMLEQSSGLDLEEIIIFGHIGKIVKVAGGIFNTHSKKADGRKEIIAAHAALSGANQQIIKDIFAQNTAEESAAYLIKKEMKYVLNSIVEAVALRAAEKIDKEIELNAAIFTFKDGIIAVSKGAEEDFDFE
ncbi:cobalt-precorrin-5B (C(1))-methyltransferase CbiD [Halanaerobium hydrogeniformans]|uniref:Cobalt-precorrin-5B C(1)-methyltransferase n=1 Tax=Halanaerobium hydrogeniformans TaxID=656519 RepID=E4RKA1_HALHG|nr:cobalt-precorrin-5B (C(1))-methyltransferase CbiD [Halanaerobium hydrogeniformans]ADQ15614.1 cobalamin biosynthesis protein CbiD [Halanaerobium hydrogeniformans]